MSIYMSNLSFSTASIYFLLVLIAYRFGNWGRTNVLMGHISPSKAVLNYEHSVETTETDV